MTPHPLLAVLLDAAAGRFPPVDGAVDVLPPLAGGLECATAFTGHAVVSTALPAADVLAADGLPRPPDGYGGAMAPDFLRRLAGPRGGIGELDLILVATGTGPAVLEGDHSGPRADTVIPRRTDFEGHDRVRRARALRQDVRVYGDERGLVTLGRGPAGRRELSIEVPGGAQGRGRGRSLLTDALALVPAGEPVFAAVTPGNARSLRAFLACGFTPVGSEVLVRPDRAVAAAHARPHDIRG
ncbi:hypothetical protein [Jiangella alkaliphila]|uniref:FR47-like protein n=1 Tax=Jiangella alkaliphila TaxID=419479 RepID=A0A1H2LN20_9ACTN|nr:hypothetical protein [Jiangella alkaliphila]SDU82319.1 hypothetical protein SAMN04488563_6413 [Jiangella alkaliphila]